MKHILITTLLGIFSFVALAQENTSAPSTTDSSTEKPAKEEKKIEAKSKVKKPRPPYRFMANFHAGIGLMNY
ncbi:MAG: hypothetical protein EP314_06225, partial [Bacteroidetes bacterium]